MTDADELLAQAQATLGRPHSATYRLQLGAHLRFDAVAHLAPYLSALGVSDAYLSPCFRCGPGSSHGYDVTDHNMLNPEIGSAESFDRMAAALAGERLGVILDIVPNHMGIVGDSNPWWMDVLENGPSSPFASFFDINWAPVKTELRDKVLLPVLPEQYGRVLESQHLSLEFFEGAFFVRYAGARLPVAPRTYAHILTYRMDGLGERLGAEDPRFLEYQSILTALDHLPGQTETDPARLSERSREKEIIKRRLAALVKDSQDIQEFIDDTVRIFNGTPREPRSFDLLDQLLSAQTYRLADWRVAGDEVNYRRFFDINHLAAIRMESREVFDASHKLILRLVGEGTVTGLRVDHPDGLYAPGEYFRRLQEGAVLHTARRLVPDLDPDRAGALGARYREEAAARPDSSGARPLWIVAEKILMPDERLPDWWVVAGTTGYDFLGSLNGLFVDRGASRSMTTMYTRFIGGGLPMADLSYAAKRLIMQVSMASEINQLGHHLDRVSETHRLSRDFTLNSLVQAIREVTACFPVYRTYVGDDGFEVKARDRGYIERAVAEAARRNPTVNVSVFDFIRDTLLLRHPADVSERDRAERHHFVMRFQQTTGPVTAKGVEDTALYIYNRLISLNEVGGDPARFGEPVATFHDRNRQRLSRWPESLLATSTHDTKRGEDVRARIHVLSEVPAEWGARVRRWRALCRRWIREASGRAAPDRNDEYLLYQTLIGAWPAQDSDSDRASFTARLCDYMEKATKEAKRTTSWINPDAAYDAAVREFVTRILAPGSAFVDDFRPFQERVAVYGMINSLAQTVLKIAAPGIPDFYQGSELWDLALVDPDNRRPVDFEARRALLDALRSRIQDAGADRSGLCRELLGGWRDGRIKLHVVHRGLTLRRERPDLFLSGAYRPLEPGGEKPEHLVAFARVDRASAAIAIVPRLVARLMGFTGALPVGSAVWGDSWISLGEPALAGVYRDRLTGLLCETESRDGAAALSVGALFSVLPVALLEREGPRG